MGIKSLEFFKSNNFANSIITEISVTNWDMDNEKYCSIGIEGDFANNEIEKLNKQEIINQTNP